MGKVFLVCPECYMEQAIRKKFGADSHFLTALGTVLQTEIFQEVEELNQFIAEHDVSRLFLVHVLQCTFLQNALGKGDPMEVEEARVLHQLVEKNQADFAGLENIKEKLILLARINMYRQAFALLETPYLGHKIEDGLLDLKGLIYDREQDSFTEVDLQVQHN